MIADSYLQEWGKRYAGYCGADCARAAGTAHRLAEAGVFLGRAVHTRTGIVGAVDGLDSIGRVILRLPSGFYANYAIDQLLLQKSIDKIG